MAGRIGLLRTGCAVVFVSALAFSSTAEAAPDEKTSERLYNDARTAFDKNDFDRACPLFIEYYDLNPVPASLFILAECFARWGKPAKALSHFESYVRMTADAPPSPVQEQRARMAYEHIAKLSALVAKVTPVLAPTLKGPTVVKLDGVPVTMPVDHPIVVEPGEHVFELMTEDGTRTQKRFMLGTGEARRIELGGAPEEQPRAEPKPARSDEPSQRRFTTPVIIAGGVGIAGVAVGSLFGVLALGTKSDIDAHCTDRECDAQGLRDVDRGKTWATVSTVGFAVGIVGLAAAVVLYVTQPKASTTAFSTVGRF